MAGVVKSAGSMVRSYSTTAVVRVGVNDWTANQASSDEIDLREMSAGSIHAGDACAVTTITIYASHVSGGTFNRAFDAAGTALTVTVTAGTVRCLPDSVLKFPFIKLIGNVAGTVSVFLKS